MSDLRKKSTSAAIWSAIDKFSEQGIKFILGLIVARLLFPSDYGLVGMIAIFLALPEVLINSGFGPALIQKKSASNTDFSTVFYFNIVVGILLYGVLYFAAPLISIFFNEPQLTLLTRVLGLTFIINSFALIQRTILTKNLNFKTQTKINLISIFPSGLIGVLLAYLGYGVWALVFQSISRQIMVTVSFWILNKWRPKLVFSFKSLRSLFVFGSNLLMVGLISSAFSRIYLIVIGKFFSAESLGYYTRAQQFVTLPANSLTSIIDRIAFPIFSTIQNDDAKLLRGYRKTVVLGAFFNFPLMLGIAVISEPLIRFLLTDKWLLAVPYLQLMCIGSFLTPMQNLTLSLIKAKGDSRLFLKLDIFKKILTVSTLLVTYRWGIIAIIYGSIVLAYLSFYINFYFVGKKLNFSFGRQLIDIAPYALIAVISAIAMYLVGHLTPNSDLLTILIQTSVGIVVYLGISRLFKVEAFQESVQVLVGIKAKFQKNK